MDKTSKEYIIGLLSRNDKVGKIAVARALVHLYNSQTSEEQCTNSVQADNGVGFTPVDAEFMSSCAKYVIRGYELTDRQLAALQKENRKGVPRIAKYWKQLQNVAKINAERKKES